MPTSVTKMSVGNPASTSFAGMPAAMVPTRKAPARPSKPRFTRSTAPAAKIATNTAIVSKIMPAPSPHADRGAPFSSQSASVIRVVPLPIAPVVT